MAYVDLRPYKLKVKKKEEPSTDTNTGTESSTAPNTDFLGALAGVGQQESSSMQSVTSNKDVIEILNLLNEKLSRVEEKMYRIERKIDERGYGD